MRRKKKKQRIAKERKKIQVSNSHIKPVTAAGGIVYRLDRDKAPEVLMIFRNGVWDLPKGKHEQGETVEMCAAREVSEEVGSKIPALINKIGETYHEYTEKGVLKGKTTHWYSMIFTCEQDLVPQTEEGIEKIEWVAYHTAIEKTGYENLKKILKKFRV